MDWRGEKIVLIRIHRARPESASAGSAPLGGKLRSCRHYLGNELRIAAGATGNKYSSAREPTFMTMLLLKAVMRGILMGNIAQRSYNDLIAV